MWFSRSQHETRLYKLCKWGKDHGTTAIEKLRPQRKFTECAHYSNLVNGAQVYLDKVADEDVAYLLDIETNKKSDVIDIENGSTNDSDNGSSLDIDSENSWDPDLDTSDIGDDELYGEFGDEEGETWEIDESEVNNLVNDWKESFGLTDDQIESLLHETIESSEDPEDKTAEENEAGKAACRPTKNKAVGGEYSCSYHVHIIYSIQLISL